jgi:hypothetical protein
LAFPAGGWQAQFNGGIFLCSGYVDTMQKAEQLWDAVSQHGYQRALFSQLCMPDQEWDQIVAENTILTWLARKKDLSYQVGHLALPTEPFYVPQAPSPISEFFHRAVDEVLHLQNDKTWLCYCFLLGEEIEKIQKSFQLESLETYTLEGYFEDFLIEKKAMHLRLLELGEVEIILKLGSLRQLIDYPVKQGEEFLSLERQLIKVRYEISQRLAILRQGLMQISSIITSIESNHPELLRFKRSAIILSSLMGNHFKWGQKLLLMQLLHEEWHIASLLTGQDEMQLSMAFAIQGAISLWKKKHGANAAMELALHWDLKKEEEKRSLKQYVAKLIELRCFSNEAELQSSAIHRDYLEFLA